MAEASRVIGFTELKERYLPQRYPLLLLDRVTGFAAGEWIEAIKAVTGNSPDLVGHFPERAILPGSAMMQSFAQLGIVFFKVTNGALADNELTVVTSFKIRLMAPVIPGEIMRLNSPPAGSLRPSASSEATPRSMAARWRQSP